MPDFGRRGFLGGAGLLAGVAAGCSPAKDPYAAEKPAAPVERGLRVGTERFVLTTCGLCQAGCGLRVRVVDGRAVKVEGNAESPVNRGGVCARGQAGLELLVHPERIRGPRRRVGARGENRWQDISWDEAIARLASELGKVRADGEPQSLVLVDGESSGMTNALWGRFLEAFGSPNHIGTGATGSGGVARAVRRMTRTAGLPGYDFERSRCVLLVGTGPLESSPQFMDLARALAGEARPRLVCASPRLPSCAVVVDEWLSLAPDGSAPFLLGIVHVLLRDELGDESALEMASGYAPWTASDGGAQPGLRARVLADFSPDKAGALAGIPAATIEQVARDLVATRPSVVVADESLCDPAAASAVIVVNALLGSLDAPGGMRLDPGGSPRNFAKLDLDGIAQAGLRAPTIDGREPDGREPEGREPGASEPGQRDADGAHLLALPEAMIAGKPYAARALLFSGPSPLAFLPAPQRWQEALAKVPFIASFSPFLDESALLSDLLLPDHTLFERWEIVEPGRGSGVLALRQPVVPPQLSTLQTGDVILRLARALGDGFARAFPWTDFRQASLAALQTIEGGADAVMGALESTGVWRAPAGDTSGKPARSPGRPRLFDVRGVLPSTQPSAVGEPVRFPFVLLPFRGPGYAEGGVRAMAWLRELPLAGGDPWLDHVEISVEDAGRLGIEDGDALVVESPAAEVAVRALVCDRVRPGVLGLPLGGGPSHARDFALGSARLLSSLADEASGYWLANAARVQVRKIA